MNYYTISFNTSTGTKRTFRINNPVTGISNTDAQDAIDQMAANDIFDPAKGTIEGLHKMELVAIDRTQIL